MTDLTDAELTEMYDSTNDPRILMLIAEVRRWRAHRWFPEYRWVVVDKHGMELRPAQDNMEMLAPGEMITKVFNGWREYAPVGSPEGADGPEGHEDE